MTFSETKSPNCDISSRLRKKTSQYCEIVSIAVLVFYSVAKTKESEGARCTFSQL